MHVLLICHLRQLLSNSLQLNFLLTIYSLGCLQSLSYTLLRGGKKFRIRNWLVKRSPEWQFYTTDIIAIIYHRRGKSLSAFTKITSLVSDASLGSYRGVAR